ncbi:MAG TPA: hypothetical protein VGI39_17395, partial [Polyangiaceae bacterium]
RTIHLALADLHEHQLLDVPAAEKHLEAAAAIDPRAEDVLDRLERLYREGGRFVDLERVLEQRAHAGDDGARVRALLRLADLYEREFVKPKRAAARLEDALAIDPESKEALSALARCYRSTRSWQELARVLQTLGRVGAEAEERALVLVQAADVLETKLNEPKEAARVYRAAFGLDDRNASVLGALARLAKRAGDWQREVGYRERLADLETEGEAKARLLVGIGETLVVDDRDRTMARGHFARAATIHPGCVAAWEALEREARRDRALDRAAAFLEKRIEHTDSPRLGAVLLVQLGELRTALGEHARAIVAFERAIVTDQTNEAAAEHMLPRYIETGRWEEARPLCAFLLRVARRNEDAVRTFELERTASRLAAALHDEGEALSAAVAAYRIRPVVGAMEDAVEATHRVRKSPQHVAAVREVLEEIEADRGRLSPEGLIRLAEIRKEQGEGERAEGLYLEVLRGEGVTVGGETVALTGFVRSALTGLVSLAVEREDWGAAGAYKATLARLVPDEAERFALFEETGTLFALYARDLPAAALAYEEARALRPRDHWVLHMLMWIYTELHLWTELVSVLRSIAPLETDAPLQAKAVYASALVLRDRLEDLPNAAREFERALDLDPSRLEAFERVVRIWTERRDWGELEAVYRRMLARPLRGEGAEELQHRLLFQLGLVLRDRLGRKDAALVVFRQAARLRPTDDMTRRSVCELLVLSDAVDKAAQVTGEAIARNPDRAELYGELADLFARQGAFDRAWCALDAMGALGGSPTAAQVRLYSSHEPVRLLDVRRGLPLDSWWGSVRHPDLDPWFTALFGHVIPLLQRAGALRTRRGSEGRVTPLENDSRQAGRVLGMARAATRVLSAAPLSLHARRGPIPMVARHGGKGGVLVSVEACEAVADSVLSFLIGERIVEHLPELAARALTSSPSELSGLLYAVAHVVRGRPPPRPGHPTARLDELLRRSITEDERKAIGTLISSGQASGASFDVVHWMRCVDASSARVGLLLAGHVEAARRAMAIEPQFPGAAGGGERLHELLLFSVSDAYAALRGGMGVAVKED